jgi:tetraacyldisaccharide 4'-kinase
MVRVMRIEDIWFGQSVAAKVARVALLPLSGVYALGMAGYRAMYRLGIKRAQKPHKKIVCVGNLVAGGSGKTPVTIHIAQNLCDLGFKVVLGCSGYGSPRSEAASLAPDGALNSAEWGDEPSEIRDALPWVPIIVGRRRVLAAEICARHFPDSILLMDDGFQHLPLAKDITIVLDRGVHGDRLPFPAGPCRETRLLANPTLYLPSEKFGIKYSDLELTEPLLPGARINLLCAIAKPNNFMRSLTDLGLTPVVSRLLADHDPLTDANLFKCENVYPWVVTAKDWVKLRNRKDLDHVKIIIARRTAIIEPHEEFREWLKIKLG